MIMTKGRSSGSQPALDEVVNFFYSLVTKRESRKTHSPTETLNEWTQECQKGNSGRTAVFCAHRRDICKVDKREAWFYYEGVVTIG